MLVIVLCSGYLKEPYFKKWRGPKCLLPIKDDGTTILDYQMDMYNKFGLEVVLVCGYGTKEIIEHIRKKKYTVKIIMDKTFMEDYSIPRTLKEIEGEINMIPEFLMIHGDLIFKDDLLEYLTTCTGYDICRANRQNMAFRFTNVGFLKMMWELRNGYFEGLNSPLWRELEDKVTFAPSPVIWMYDVDRDEEWNTMKRMFK